MNLLPLLAQSTAVGLLDGLKSDERFVLLLVAMLCVTAAVIVGVISVSNANRRVRQHEAELDLTRDLLDQGKSAEEIEQILSSVTPRG